MHIQVSHVSKSFSGVDILSDVSFSLSGKARVGLIGANGSGKSTLLKLIAGKEQPDSGQISFHPQNLNIGFLPQVFGSSESLSSGQKLKHALEDILSNHPDVLLLDEPTNHLDWQGMAWLEEIMARFSGPILFISHDRYFLDRVSTQILELDQGKIKQYGGNYSLYKQQKETEIDSQARAYSEQQKHVQKLQARVFTIKNRTQQLEVSTTSSDHYVRRKAAKQAKSALAMEKRIQKEILESGISAPEPNWEMRALFRPQHEPSPTVVSIKNLSYKQILSCVSLTIVRNTRWAVIGPNGSGKTTLIKLILGELSPDSGSVQLGNGVEVGYLSQEHLELTGNQTVLEELSSSSISPTQAYQLLHRFLLPAEKINQPVNSLSSGEKAKLLLAKVMSRGANLIILDEPTNHLDIPSREALESALASFPGTLIVSSHDRYFLKNINISHIFEAKVL